jgi:hypothetical protein
MAAEGWYLDPYRKHTDRWFSDGRPTKLVRDSGVESYDQPPDEPMTSALVESPENESHGGADLRRADDAELSGGDPSKGLWEQGLSMWSDYYDAGKRAGEP